MNIRSAFALIAGSLLLPLPSHACLNDRDSDALAIQAKKLPDVVRVVTGRFERNPPLYYQMRVTRVKAELQKNPHQWALYDDLAVALDRLHRDDEAISWIEKKRTQLPKYNATRPEIKEAWYRYYANVGTFRVHRWLKNGAKPATRAQMVRARDEIARAIEIKPNAHFGREKYQWMAMNWILLPKEQKYHTWSLGSYLEDQDRWEMFTAPQEHIKFPNRKAAVEGLCGLIVLGAAWESPDIFDALGQALDYRDGVTLRQFALHRTVELMTQGKKPLGRIDGEQVMGSLLSGNVMETGVGVNDVNYKALSRLYDELRLEADQWSASRIAFMNARLRQGRHPDTDATFWNGYHPAPPPSLDIPWFNHKLGRYEGTPAPPDWYAIKVYAAGGFVICLALWAIWRKAVAARS